MSDKKTIRDRVVDPGYRLPATIEPGDDVCIRVYVPKDSLYLAAFWAQYERLGMWLAWERGGTRAKEAAAAWKVRIAKARQINDCAEGDCGIMDVRTKPNYPCVLQKWDDCESDWVDFADMRLCAPKMRVNGVGAIEQWDGTQWVSVAPGESEGGQYDPGHDLNNQIAHYDPPPSGQDAKCLAAINAATYLQAAIDASMTELKELPYLVRLVDSILSTWYWRVYGFANLVTDWIVPELWEMTWAQAHTMMQDKSLTNEDDIIAVDIIEDVICSLYDAYNDDGTMSEANFDGLMGNLQEIIDNETPNTPKSIKLEWFMLLSWPGPTWMANISNNAGIDEYECSCCQQLVYDFTLGDQLGWSAYSANTTVWDGTGWHDGYPSEKTEDGVSVSSPVMPAIRIRKVELYLDIVMEGSNPSAALYRYYSSWSQWRRTYDNLQVYTWSGLDWTPNGTSERINVNIDEYTGGPNTHTDARIVKVIVYYGDNC